jgi:hypothetical protein
MLTLLKKTYVPFTREQLAEVPVTDRGSRSKIWEGVQHYSLVQSTIELLLSEFGCTPINEVYAVSPNGAAMFGGFELNREDKPFLLMSSPQDMQASIGFSHSNDSRKSINFVAGGRVLLCENGAAWGQEKVQRRHTTGLNLRDWLLAAIRKIWRRLTGTGDMFEQLQQTGVRASDHDAMLTLICRSGIIPWYLGGELDSIWLVYIDSGRALWVPEETRHEWNANGTLPPNAWDWYNCATHVIKSLPASRQQWALNKAFDLVLDYNHIDPNR